MVGGCDFSHAPHHFMTLCARTLQEQPTRPAQNPPFLIFPSFSLDRQALYRRYGRFFAEFLSEKSLVPLGLLALSTSVGLRYDAFSLNLEVFLGRLFAYINEGKPSSYQDARGSLLKVDSRICQTATALAPDAKPIRRICSFPPSLHRTRKGGPEY